MRQATKDLCFFSEAELFMQIGQNKKRRGNRNPHTQRDRDREGSHWGSERQGGRVVQRGTREETESI